MDRKTFLKRTLAIGACSASGGATLLGGGLAMAQSESDEVERERKFKEEWIVAMMRNLEAQFDEKSRIGLMESCGRACARRGAIHLAESCQGDVSKMTGQLSRIPDLEIENMDNDALRVTYRKCFCELVSHGSDRLPDAYCECSKGWLLEMFGTAAQKPVQVEIVQTIKRGGSACEFKVHLDF